MQTQTPHTPTLDDVWLLFKETDRKMQETDRQIQETALRIKETDRQMQETDQRIEKLREEMQLSIKAANASIGKLGNRLGEFVEEAVRPAAVRLFRECGIDVHETQRNIKVQRLGESLELDLLVVNDQDTVAIECKSNLSIDDVNEHLERLAKIKRLIPRYKNNRVLGAVAGMVIPDNVAAYAIKKGLYVIGQTGDHLALRNASTFVPMVW